MPDATSIESDVCIIGSGAAGLAIASRFFDRSLRVALLESGGMDLEGAIQSLYRGRVVGQSHAPLDTCRLRLFGGTTNHWTAHVRPLEPIDFEARAWVPDSGWPLDRAELAPHYEAARELLALPEAPFDLHRLARTGHGAALRFEGGRVATVVRHIVPVPQRLLGQQLRERMSRSSNVHTYLHASVLGIDLDEGQRRVRRLRIGNLEGRRLTATARLYVLAAGGIENPRILLLSSIGTGTGGDRRPVGAFFANHPEAWGGYLQPSRPLPQLGLYTGVADGQGTARAFLQLSPELQRRLELLNCWIDPMPNRRSQMLGMALQSQSTSDEPPTLPELDFGDEDVASLAADVDHPGVSDPGRGAPPAPVGLRVIAEPVPNPASRVRLDDERDAFGQPRAQLDWRLDARVAESTRRTLETFAQEVGASGWGRVRIIFPEDGFASVATLHSHHHMGTTRMHADPSRGVVDADCRVHGISNLFVAGSSVFPTYGTANPTYTILALAFRLADRLAAELG